MTITVVLQEAFPDQKTIGDIKYKNDVNGRGHRFDSRLVVHVGPHITRVI